TPGAVFQFVQILQQVGGEDFLRIAVFGEEAADVIQQLKGSRQVIASVDVKDPIQSQARSSGPLAAQRVGNGEQRHGKLALTEGKTRMDDGDVAAMVDQIPADILVLDPTAD